MNIFHLHKDPKICAKYHCDKHVVKMILETAQMLSTAYRRNFGDNNELTIQHYAPAGPSGGNFIEGDSAGKNLFIRSKVNQEQLKNILIKNQFKNCGYRNLSGGIVSIHYGWKL